MPKWWNYGGTDAKLKKSEEKRHKKKSSKTAYLSHFQGLVCGRGRRMPTARKDCVSNNENFN